ncbi:hypothetical protein ACN20G_11525 [Streptomyces sp. BI20]|uniref:tRNA adenosine deaminase-associated protein n=1 Tax=Streptomyces sp. BI20 TaxID=3403460 RepID=UPI003C794760
MYFAALLARTEDGWVASDMELDSVETLTDLTELAREGAVEDDTVVVLVEQEDAWFGVIRIDGEEDPRLYVSNAALAARSSYGALLTEELLGTDSNEDEDLDVLDLDGTEGDEEEEPTAHYPDDPDEADPAPDTDPVAEAHVSAPRQGGDRAPQGPLGDDRLLADLGVSARELAAFDGDAIGELAEALGASEVLEAVR